MWWENIQNLFEKFGCDKKKEGRKDGGKGDPTNYIACPEQEVYGKTEKELQTPLL